MIFTSLSFVYQYASVFQRATINKFVHKFGCPKRICLEKPLLQHFTVLYLAPEAIDALYAYMKTETQLNRVKGLPIFRCVGKK